MYFQHQAVLSFAIIQRRCEVRSIVQCCYVERHPMFARLSKLFSSRRDWKYPTPVPELAKDLDFRTLKEFRGDALPQSNTINWLDAPDAVEEIERRRAAGRITDEEAQACLYWVQYGYLVVEKLFSAEELDAAFEAYEKALLAGELGSIDVVSPNGLLYDRKLDPALTVPALKALQHHPKLMRWTDLLLGRKTVPFQTIMGHAGSGQRAHSDSIHMTTYPAGFMVASWTAFEDIDEDSGPLEYYPKSHRLPYLLSREAGIEPAQFRKEGYAVYSKLYEPAIAELCSAHGFERKLFLPKKGDTLFWHANLIHGGSARANPNRSRKALVCHNFAEGVLSYHDLSGLPTRIHTQA